ncbi:MAG: sigma-70 family RNA polymerase sigma factor [Woeseia sp.]
MTQDAASSGITALLHDWQAGDESALERITPYLHEELRRLAASHMRRESGGHTLQSTALVNEAYLRLVDVELDFASRAHFLAIASRVMRRVLVDHARRKQRAKRGGPARDLTLDESIYMADAADPSVLDLDDALNKLAAFDARMAGGIELIYFGGLTTAEAAEALGISRVTLHDDLKLAKAWLQRELG